MVDSLDFVLYIISSLTGGERCWRKCNVPLPNRLYGSGKNSRKCHGRYLLPLMVDTKKNEIVSDDLDYIRKVIIEYDTTRNNMSKTKLTGNA